MIQIHASIKPIISLTKFLDKTNINLKVLFYNVAFLPYTQYGEVDYKLRDIVSVDNLTVMFPNALNLLKVIEILKDIS